MCCNEIKPAIIVLLEGILVFQRYFVSSISIELEKFSFQFFVFGKRAVYCKLKWKNFKQMHTDNAENGKSAPRNYAISSCGARKTIKYLEIWNNKKAEKDNNKFSIFYSIKIYSNHHHRHHSL